MIDLVVGLGEIGKPLLELLKLKGIDAVGIDIQPKRINKRVEFLHICFPYSHWFVADVKKYQAKYQPRYTVVHSTVRPRTSKKVNAIYSPVRGRHKTMLDDLQYYSKYYSGKRNYSFEKRFMECRITKGQEVVREFIVCLLVSSNFRCSTGLSGRNQVDTSPPAPVILLPSYFAIKLGLQRSVIFYT